MAGRYANALFDLARDANAIDAVSAYLERFDAMVADSADLTRLVRSPGFSVAEQERGDVERDLVDEPGTEVLLCR